MESLKYLAILIEDKMKLSRLECKKEKIANVLTKNQERRLIRCEGCEDL